MNWKSGALCPKSTASITYMKSLFEMSSKYSCQAIINIYFKTLKFDKYGKFLNLNSESKINYSMAQ